MKIDLDKEDEVLIEYGKTSIDDKYCEDIQIECEDRIDYILGMPMDNIVFMKYYFKAKNFDPEDEDFILEVLKYKDNKKNKLNHIKPKPSYNINKNHDYNSNWFENTYTYNLNGDNL